MGHKIRPQKWIAMGAVISATLGAEFTAAPAFASDPCDGSLAESTDVATQRREDCAAKKAAEKASKNDKISAGLWTAVTAVCTVSCAKAITGDTGTWCTYSNWAGMGADILLSKDIVAGIAGNLPSLAVSYIMGESAKSAAADAAASKVNKASCVTAIFSAAKAFQKFSSAKEQDGLASDLGEQAAELKNHQGTTVAIGGQDASGGTTGTGGSNGTPPAGSASVAQKESPAENACNQAQGSNNAAAHISCAVAADPGLAPVMDPKFKDEFEKNTGKKLGDFLAEAASSRSPEGSMMSAMGGAGFNGDQMKQIAAALQKTKQSMAFDVPGAVARGGGGGSKGSNEGDDMAQIMAGLMGQFMPKEGEDQPPAGFSIMDFKSLTRSPAAVAEDRSINIFQRVSFRYHYVGRRVLSGRP